MEGLHNYCQGKRHLMRMCNFIIPTDFQVQRDLKILSAEEHHRFWEKLIKDLLRALKVLMTAACHIAELMTVQIVTTTTEHESTKKFLINLYGVHKHLNFKIT